jgi:ribosomal protein S18 acetylase RimI-like enzyme
VRVQLAVEEDLPAWLALAREVEPLFGPMAEEPGFARAVRSNVSRGSAFCVRRADDPAPAPLRGAILFDSRDAPLHQIAWLAVASSARRAGIGRALVERCLASVRAPAVIAVVTFGADVAGGAPARRLYESLGFAPAEAAERGPEGGSRQVFRLALAPRGAAL